MTRPDMFNGLTVVRIAASLAFLLALCLAATAQEAGDPDKGKSVYNRCKACHQLGPDARNGTGPELNGIIGRPVASVEGFRYSDALTARGGTWDAQSLGAYLANPRKAVPGTRMAFPGLRSDADTANLLAYLARFDQTGQPVP